MKKFVLVFLSVFILFISLPLSSFALNGLEIDSYLSEPVPSDNVAFFAIGSSASDARLYAFFINPGQGKIQIEQDFDNGNWSFFVYNRMPDGSLYPNFPMWVGRYNLVDGTCYDLKYYSSSSSTFHNNYHQLTLTTSLSERPYYWFSGNITCTNYNGLLPDETLNPSLMHISWNGTGAYENAVMTSWVNVELLLRHLDQLAQYSFEDIDALCTAIAQHYQWFENTYFNTITGKWNLTNDKLDEIISLLGGDQDQPTFEDHSNDASQVDEYVSNEDSYLSDFGSNVDDFDSVIDDAGFNLGTITNGFSAVNLFFETFVFGFNIPYMIVFFSLVFGIFVLILGKRVR